MWAGNLPKSVNRNDLINTFSKHGAVVSITIRDAPSRDKKYAFVEFGHKTIAQNLIQHAKWKRAKPTQLRKIREKRLGLRKNERIRQLQCRHGNKFY